MIERKPFYWTFFRLSDEDDADWFAGRTLVTNGEHWMMLRDRDVGRVVPPLQLQTKLDEKRLLIRFDDEFGGEYFVHQGPIQEKR